MPLRPKLFSSKVQNNIVPYWNDQVADWSRKLWLPVDLSSSRNSNNGSWFSQTIIPNINRNYLEIKHKELNANNNDDGESHNGKRKKVQTTRWAKRKKRVSLIRSIKIRVYPNQAQKELLKQWMGCARLVYNMVIANYRQWVFMEKVPYEVLDHSISSAILARDENEQQTITIRTRHCREPLHFYLRLLHNKQLIQATPEYPRYKSNNIKPPLHHEHHRKNNGWPNREGKVMLDSKLSYNKRLGQWSFVWVYGIILQNFQRLELVDNEKELNRIIINEKELSNEVK
ncbi:23569_t:CDS:2 [Gigaspora margarita]|uniref:23569_t:CDS:1 n=1 Tax=Gigaspora margarita TaxID=4874 RepID=A0ABM8W0Q6_GIGMA|nr:23569_t:CDS:2 [Gigaspora margarita]